MTKYQYTIDSPDDADNRAGAKDYGALETMLGKARLLNPPPTATYRVRITMGGRIRQLVLQWED